MVGCLLAKCWRLGGQLIRIQFHKYISPHYILLNPMLFYTNYLWVSPFYFACHLSFLSLFQTTILKIASVWVWMCVCVFALDFYIMLRGTPCARPVSKMAAYIFSKPFPFLQKKTVPQFITLLAPKMGKKRKVDNSNFLLLDRKKEKGNFVRRWALKLQVIPDRGGGINNFLRSIIGKQGFSEFLHYIPLCIYVSIYLCSKKILYKGHGTLGFKKTPAHIWFIKVYELGNY